MWIQDPGHTGHAGLSLALIGKVVQRSVGAGYAVYLVGHEPHLQPGCTLADLGDEYAALVAEEFDSRVDLLVGNSG